MTRLEKLQEKYKEKLKNMKQTRKDESHLWDDAIRKIELI